MEAGLQHAGGKSILNSTNYEDGVPRFSKVIDLAKHYGASVVIGTIDEEGMARTADGKFAIAKTRLRAGDSRTDPAGERHLFRSARLTNFKQASRKIAATRSRPSKESVGSRKSCPVVSRFLAFPIFLLVSIRRSRVVLNSVFCTTPWKPVSMRRSSTPARSSR